MAYLKESVELVDWWIRGTSPETYTHRGSPEGVHFDLDGFLNCRDGQLPLLGDIADFYQNAIAVIKENNRPGLLAFLHSRDELRRMGIIPLASMISTDLHVGLQYIIVNSTVAQDCINTAGSPVNNFLEGSRVIIVADQVLHGHEILDARRILKIHGAGEISDAVSLMVRTDLRSKDPTHPVDFLKSHGIDLLFSHEVRVEDGVLKFNPNQRLLALTT